MERSKEQIENHLRNMLQDMLRDYNQEDSILSFSYDDEKKECNVRLSVHVVEEDQYIGFSSY